MVGAHAQPVGARPAWPSGAAAREALVWELLARVPDPEIPVLSVVDLGIVRHVHWRDTPAPHVGITPTYTGCPATEVISTAIKQALLAAGCGAAVLEEVLTPPWSSDCLSPAAHRKLAAFGIAPPAGPVASMRRLRGAPALACPRCASKDTRLVSEFGSTPCKAHYVCKACLEPFDAFKCI
jgi:ring-1,2-phenylacetyl-CoA epoxidase subunit PaaD